jgi:hypothetical protein
MGTQVMVKTLHHSKFQFRTKINENGRIYLYRTTRQSRKIVGFNPEDGGNRFLRNADIIYHTIRREITEVTQYPEEGGKMFLRKWVKLLRVSERHIPEDTMLAS